MTEKKTIQIEVAAFDRLDELDDREQLLVRSARRARSLAYAPYSNFLVGAAVLLEGGQILQGANQENASYGMTACAERTAIWGAWLAGRARDVLGIAVCGGHRDPARAAGLPRAPICPCGACRQVMLEARFRAQRPLFIVLDGGTDPDDPVGPFHRLDDVASLMPFPFDPRTLGVEPG